MEDKLQELTQRIYKEGVERAQSDARDILIKAEVEANKIVERAKTEAESLLDDAKVQVSDLESKIVGDLKNAGNQMIAVLRQETTTLLSGAAFSKNLKLTLSDAEFIATLVKELLSLWAQKGETLKSLVLDLPEALKKELDIQFQTKLKAELDQVLVLNFDRKLTNGFKIGPSEGGWKVSFTDQDFIKLLTSFMKQKTRDLLFPGQ